jgi:hypothetical protein
MSMGGLRVVTLKVLEMVIETGCGITSSQQTTKPWNEDSNAVSLNLVISTNDAFRGLSDFSCPFGLHSYVQDMFAPAHVGAKKTAAAHLASTRLVLISFPRKLPTFLTSLDPKH